MAAIGAKLPSALDLDAGFVVVRCSTEELPGS